MFAYLLHVCGVQLQQIYNCREVTKVISSTVYNITKRRPENCEENLHIFVNERTICWLLHLSKYKTPDSSSETHIITMKAEVTSAVNFLTNLLRSSKDFVRQPLRLEKFSQILINLVCEHYKSHWFPDKPFRGSGYRCIRINDMKMDPLIAKAGQLVGKQVDEMQLLLPSELTVWVDPDEVSYRIGEEGSICVLYDGVSKTTSETKLSALDLLNCKMHWNNRNSSHQSLDTPDFNRNDVTVNA